MQVIEIQSRFTITSKDKKKSTFKTYPIVTDFESFMGTFFKHGRQIVESNLLGRLSFQNFEQIWRESFDLGTVWPITSSSHFFTNNEPTICFHKIVFLIKTKFRIGRQRWQAMTIFWLLIKYLSTYSN